MVGIKDDYSKTLYKAFKVSTKNKVKLIKREEIVIIHLNYIHQVIH